MRRIRILLTSVMIIWLGCQMLTAQNRRKADSLLNITKSVSAHDSSRVIALYELSLLYRQVGSYDTAMLYAVQADTAAVHCGYKRGEGKALYYTGILYSIKSDYRTADLYYHKASAIFEEINDRKNYSTVLIAFGALKQLQGDHDGALELFLQALQIKREIKDSLTIPAAVTNIGNIYNSLGRYSEALGYFVEAHEMHRRNNDVIRYTDDWCNIANMYRLLGRNDTALLLLRASIHLADSLEHVDILPYTYGIVASIFLQQDQLDSAEFYFFKAYSVAEEIDDLYMVANHSLNLGEIYAETGRTAEAEKWFQKGLSIAVEIDAKEHIRDAHQHLSSFYSDNKDYEKALFHYKGFIAYRDTILDVEKQKSILRQEIGMQHEKDEALRKAEQNKIDAIAEEEKKKQNIIIGLISVALVLVLVFVLFLYNRFVVTRKQAQLIEQQKNEVTKQRDHVELQNAIIGEKNKSITDSITYARRIQHAILPDPALMNQLLQNSFVFYRPKDIVSGDFYWVSENENYIFYATADCTGHGVPGGFMSILGASLLNEIVNEKKVVEPSEVLNLMRANIIRSLRQTGETGENKDGMDMVLCRLDRQQNKVVFAAANNPVWILRKGELLAFAPDKQPVGIGELNARPFVQTEVHLEKGDIIYTFTDGFADQFGGPRGKKFKYRQLQEFIVANGSLSMEEQRNNLERTFDQWKGDLEQVDDVLIIGVRV